MKQRNEKELEFFGKITAGVTHEMKNILAIIRESTGLLEDIMSLESETAMPHQNKIQNSFTKIKTQIDRGVELTNQLNWFAHSADKSPIKIDLFKTTRHLITLCQRFARLKNVVLKTGSPEKSDHTVTLVTHPVQLQMALFYCILCCLDVMSNGGEITIVFERKEEKILIRNICTDDLAGKIEDVNMVTSSGAWLELKKITNYLHGRTEIDGLNGSVNLYLPEEINETSDSD
jgi:signal transduction histidine kinase